PDWSLSPRQGAHGKSPAYMCRMNVGENRALADASRSDVTRGDLAANEEGAACAAPSVWRLRYSSRRRAPANSSGSSRASGATGAPTMQPDDESFEPPSLADVPKVCSSCFGSRPLVSRTTGRLAPFTAGTARPVIMVPF